MAFQLETLQYQQAAIQSVVRVFDGNTRNSFDNATYVGVRYNHLTVSQSQLESNILEAIRENGLDPANCHLTPDRDLCIELETGTGKTLVYLKTIYELHKHYDFTKFIILVPSVAIRQGITTTINSFSKQLEAIYGFTPKSFEYDSKKLNRVASLIEEQHPQIMVMTLASFNSEDKILNQAQREDLFANLPYIEAIAQCSPVVLMDEPQVGMDTDNSVKQIARLNPLFKIRYSATHATFKNLIYRLTPYDSYRQGLVKKIEVLTCALL